MFRISALLFQPFETSSSELGRGHMAGELASLILLLLHRSLTAQLSSVLHQMGLTAFVFYGMRLSVNHSMYLILP